MSTAHLGEPTLGHVVSQLVGLTPLTPHRTHCPHRDRPKPTWLPPRQFCCPQDHYLQATYGISCDDYWRLFADQGGRCAICRRPPKPGRRLVVDHDHDTGTIDGLCHFGCNRRLPTNLRRYLTNPPGRAAGLQVAPAKLKAIQAKDRAKRASELATRTKARPPDPPSTLDQLRSMTRKGA